MRMRACCAEAKQAKHVEVPFASDGKVSASGIQQSISMTSSSVRYKGSKGHQRLMKACEGALMQCWAFEEDLVRSYIYL
eukprot:412366-Pelagomonas_calceolata.AAC.1